MRFLIIAGTVLSSFAFADAVYAEEPLVHTDTFQKAQVLEVVDEKEGIAPGLGVSYSSQTIRVEILEGPDRDTVVTFDNDYIQLNAGDVFYARHQTSSIDDADYWSVAEPYRLPVLGIVLVAFLGFLFAFGGWQGVRGLASLIGSLVLIFFLLIPGIASGYSPILVSIGVASLVIVIGSYITHGFTKTTTAAVVGMLMTVVLTGIGAWIAVSAANLSGFASDESVYLNLNAGGAIDMLGLLFGAIIIGLLGVLYDVAIGQAVAVEELYRAGKHLSRGAVYGRAIRIGREHIGALVNTLAIAYVGAALPLFLLIQHSTADFWFIVNSELFATEILRILIGSIGVIAAVPITTIVATYMLSGTVSKG